MLSQESILYEDNHLLALFKPSGLLVQGDNTGDQTLFNIAKNYIKEKYNKPGNVYMGLLHRIDRPVSGVIVFAKTTKAAQRMCELFKKHQIVKIYWAIVQNGTIKPSGEFEDYIIRHGRRSFISKNDNIKAQFARLSYKTIKSTNELSLLEIKLDTGRHHQIRVQFAKRGHPVIGDKKYGSRFALPEGQIALLARRLEFIHPVSSKQIKIESPVPQIWPWIEKDLFIHKGFILELL